MKKSKVLFASLLCALAMGKFEAFADDSFGTETLISGKKFTQVQSANDGALSGLTAISRTIIDCEIANKTANRYAGAIYAAGTNMILGENNYFHDNKAKYGGAVTNTNNLTITSNTFKNNIATSGGGGAFANLQGTTKINNSTFEVNSAATGGAIFNMRGTTTIEGSTFKENNATSGGGAIFVNGGGLIINSGSAKTTFDNNTSADGGAIHNNSQGYFNIDGVDFLNNTATKNGGAIFESGNSQKSTIKNSYFYNNSSTNGGGAIYARNAKKSEVVIDNTIFEKNSSKIQGGAITIQAPPNAASQGQTSYTVINSKFLNNSGANAGGAIANYDKLILQDTDFYGNFSENPRDNITPTAEGGGGGALMLGSKSQTEIIGGVFENNKSAGYGGAIGTRPSTQGNNINAKLDIVGAQFVGNHAELDGGAIDNYFYNNKSGEGVTISDVTFKGNTAGGNGGAIMNNAKAGANTVGGKMNISGGEFTNNVASGNGGAIATFEDLVVEDVNFTNNNAGSEGGAIWANQDVTLNAVGSDVVLSGNSAKEGGDIFMNAEGSKLNINAAKDKTINIASGISGNSNGYDMLVNHNGGTGSLVINSIIENADVNVKNGTLHLAQGSELTNSALTMASNTTLNTVNNQITAFGNNVTLDNNVNIIADVDLANGTGDNFKNANVKGNVKIAGIQAVGNTTENNVSVNLAEALGLDSKKLDIAPELKSSSAVKTLTPIRYLQGGISDDGNLVMAPTGNGYKDFNPAVMASPVAAQIGGYLTQLNSYDEAFRNMDMYMLMTKKERQAMKLRNKYAAADSNLVFDPTASAYDDRSVWIRPYATFENVPLKNGPKVSNVAYGSYFGVDSELYDLGHGWDGMYGVYAGYNGSHQTYDGVGIYQNGGTLGLVGMAYKGNFFTGLTLNAGANAGEANTVYGPDNFSMLMAGIANKTGYNIELADGKFVIQPSVQLSYSFVNTFDYTNAAGVRIDSDPLNVLQIEPGIKFIGNLKNGWQPYAGVSVVWNIMDKTDFKANDVTLPELSIKPYVKYGVGVRKTWGNVCTGYFQTYMTNGGRNGVGLQAGFRFMLGKDGISSLRKSNSVPELPKAKVSLSTAK